MLCVLMEMLFYWKKKFRENDIPIIGRIKSDRFIIDAKTLKEKDFEEILGAAERIFL